MEEAENGREAPANDKNGNRRLPVVDEEEEEEEKEEGDGEEED